MRPGRRDISCAATDSSGDGSALVLAEVTELTPETFAQRLHNQLKPGEFWPGRKLHTLNRAGRLEVIDGNRIQPRWPGLAGRAGNG